MMGIRQFTAAIFLISAVSMGSLGAVQEFWDRPYEEWTSAEVEQMLTDSPWSGQVILESMEWSPEEGRESPIQTTYTIRLFSALPVRSAFVRAFQLLNTYDSLSGREREKLSEKYSTDLPEAASHIILSIEISSESPTLENRIKSGLENNNLETLQEHIFLTSDRLGKIPVEGFRPMSPEGTGLKLLFPREVEGEPVLSSEDNGLAFEMTVPWMAQTISFYWQTDDLIFDSQLTF